MSIIGSKYCMETSYTKTFLSFVWNSHLTGCPVFHLLNLVTLHWGPSQDINLLNANQSDLLRESNLITMGGSTELAWKERKKIFHTCLQDLLSKPTTFLGVMMNFLMVSSESSSCLKVKGRRSLETSYVVYHVHF